MQSISGPRDPPPSPLIAYVDDNVAMRYSVSRILRGAGFVVAEGGTGEDALRLARGGVELVILDLKLPDLSGFEVCRRIKEDAQTSFVPVLHLTATYKGDEQKVAALESGADAYLTHPVEPVVLLATVRALLRARRAERLVHETARHWQETFDAMQEGVEILDPYGFIVRCNKTMAEWRGQPPEELVGRTAVPFFAGAEEPAEGWPYQRALRTLKRESSLVRKDDRWYRVTADPILDAGGRCEGVVRVVFDVTDQKRVEAERDAVHERVLAVLSSITEAYFALDRQWRFVEANPVAADRIFQRPLEDLVGKVLWDEFPAAADSPFAQQARQVMETRQAAHFESRSDRLQAWYEVHAYARGEHLEFYLRDITERKKAEADKEEALRREREARTEAEAANRLKDDFLATLSHELRTPLNAILGWTHLLRSGPPDAAARAPDVIERNARLQAQMIADILDVSRIVSGKLQLEVGAVDMEAVMRAAVDAVRPAADAKDIRIEAALEVGGAEVSGDADRLQQVVWNLLANSIKFSPRGSEVRVRLCADERDVTLRVQDDGIGIEPAFLPHVFERFRQADGTYARAHGGVGLGLAIVRHLVEAHGGTVTAESAGVGSGSTFVVTIPRARGERPDAPRVEPREAEAVPRPVPAGPLARLDGVSVLAVDDDADTLNAMEIILASQGADVTTARSVAAAREAILRVRPHVVLCDIGMPDEDGYALLEWLRAFSASSGERMATVAVTAYAAEADRSRALAAGFDAYLPKPLHPDDVVRLVARVGAQTEVRRE